MEKETGETIYVIILMLFILWDFYEYTADKNIILGYYAQKILVGIQKEL